MTEKMIKTEAEGEGPIPDKMQVFLESLDNQSRSIVTSLSHRNHASIDELAFETGIPHHEVLRRMNEVIIPQSRKILAKHAVRFEKSRIDPVTGENVIFSWWIDKNIPLYLNNIEVFDDTHSVLLIAEVPGLTLSEPFSSRIHYRNGVLQIELFKESETITTSYPEDKE